MPRSSRHQSSKHGSREAREYSDSERDSGVKDHRKGKGESVAGKDPRDSGLSEKRKLDSRSGTGNEEHSDEYSSSKRRRERGGNGGGVERRNVGGDKEQSEAAKKAGPSDSKRRRRGESGEEVKKHRNSGRKEGREGRRRTSLDKDEFEVHDDYTDVLKVDELQSPELDDQLERQMKKKRDSGDDDKHRDDVGDGYNRRLSSRNEIDKDRRQKDGKRKGEKYRVKYREEMDREIKHQHDKQQDEHYAKDHISIKFNDKHAREEKDSLEFRQKRTKLPKSDRDRDHNHDRDCDLESGRAHERHYERVHGRDYERDQAWDFDRDNDHYRDRDCDCDCDHDRHGHHDRDGSHLDDPSARSKDSGTKNKTLYGHDDYTDTKSRVVKGQYHDREKTSLSSGRVDSDVDRGRSQPRKAHIDSTGTSNKRRSSPASNTRIVKDEYRNANSDDRLVRELTQEKLLLDEPQVESSFYDGTCQGNASLIPPPPAFRAALEGPFVGSVEDDVRDNSNARYRRSSDPGFGRGHGNSWTAVPNWTSPSSNGFVSFQPGPAHGGFPTMMLPFTSQPLFGVRPSMEVNHAGIPYHITDADRFPGYLRPLGWQNAMDGTGPPHLHGWESNNGVFKDDPHMYGRSDWDQNRHSTNSYGWESGSETWKEQHGDSKKGLPSPTGKDGSVPVQLDDNLTDQTIQVSQDDEHNQDKFHEKSPESSHPNSLSKLQLNSLSALEKVSDPSTPSDNTTFFSRFYLSKLDISSDLVITELYDQCMCLVNVDKNASIDADASAKLFQKNVSGAQKIYTATFSRHSPLPAIDNSIFQRAIDIYKKQKVELPNGGQVDIISASNQVQVDESVPIPSLGSRQVSASASNGTEDLPMSTLGDKKLEALSPAKEHLEEIDQTCSQKGLDHDCTHSSKLVMSSPCPGHEKQIEPVAGLREKEGEVTSDKVNSGDAEEDNPMAFENESQLAPPSGDDGDSMNSKAKTAGFAHHTDEKQGFGDTVVSPLIFEDGSPRACDALMPGSNESESLMLSRIHHSPEITH